MKPILLLPSSQQYSSALEKILDNGFSKSYFIPDPDKIPEWIETGKLQEHVYLIILDSAPNPKYDAYELLQMLKNNASTRRIPVYILSSTTDPADRIKALSLNVTEYNTFPIRKQETTLQIERIIDSYLENKNIEDGLRLITGIQKYKLNKKRKTEKNLEGIIHAQENVLLMSRNELLQANQKLEQYYEARLQAMNEKSELQMMFGKYISPSVVEYMMNHEGQKSLRGEKRDVSVLFCDLRGFTAMSEKMEPAKVVVLLNEFFTELTETIIKHNGMVDKYSGDNIMALFGAPVPLKDHQEQILLAAINMRKKFAIIQKNWAKLYNTHVGMGIGINSGPAIIGNLGSYHKISFTAIGDTINTAARFEKHAMDGQIVFGDSFLEKLSNKFLNKYKIKPEPLGEASLKGKKGKFRIYTALTPDHLDIYPGKRHL